MDVGVQGFGVWFCFGLVRLGFANWICYIA